jgi:hypothetical protein
MQTLKMKTLQFGQRDATLRAKTFFIQIHSKKKTNINLIYNTIQYNIFLFSQDYI